MSIFTFKVNSGRFEFRPVPASAMRKIAERTKTSIVDRIRRGVNVADSPSKSLTQAYARRKSGAGLPPTRDLVFSGKTLNQITVTRVSKMRARIGVDDQLASVVLKTQDKYEKMTGVSPNDHRAFEAAVKDVLANYIPAQFKQIRKVY